jgi:hypothetical protein
MLPLTRSIGWASFDGYDKRFDGGVRTIVAGIAAERDVALHARSPYRTLFSARRYV